MSKKDDIGKFCWKCLDEGKKTLATTERNGFPLCNEHREIDPDAMGSILFKLICKAV